MSNFWQRFHLSEFTRHLIAGDRQSTKDERGWLQLFALEKWKPIRALADVAGEKGVGNG